MNSLDQSLVSARYQVSCDPSRMGVTVTGRSSQNSGQVTWVTPSTLAWIESILSERFGRRFFLRLIDAATSSVMIDNGGRSIVLPLNGEFDCDGRTLSCPHWEASVEGWLAPLGRPLPMPGGLEPLKKLIWKTNEGFHIHYDILGLTYWMLSRREEIGRTDLDAHGRFPASASHAYKHGYLERPIVDEWLDILGQVMQRTWPGIELTQHRFDMKLSHDVDGPSRYGFLPWAGIARTMAGNALKRADLVGAAQAPWIRLRTTDRLHPSDPANTFDWIMDVSEQHGLASAFYFICGRTSPQHDAHYEPEHPAIRRLMRSIHERGHEIGLHPSYDTYRNPDAIVSEARRLRAVADSEDIRQPHWGGRMHFLRWEHPTTIYGWELAGMDYDSTLSYADHAGFRCGTCFEYPAFDPVAERMLNLRIRPLVAMDCSVMAPRYMGLGDGERAFEKFRQLKDACRAVGGSFTLLWHNAEFDSEAKRELYRSVVAH